MNEKVVLLTKMQQLPVTIISYLSPSPPSGQAEDVKCSSSQTSLLMMNWLADSMFLQIWSSKTAAFLTNSDRGGRGRGRDGHDNRSQCSYCKRMRHTQDRCYSLHGFPRKAANMSQVQVVDATKKDDSPQENKVLLSDNEYKEYLELKAATYSNVSSSVPQFDNSSICFSQSLPSASLDSRLW